MAKPANAKNDPAALSPEETSFEEALDRLEEVIREMESENLPLEKLIENYERGSKLFEHCQKRLDEAEGRIEIIRKNRNGERVASPFEGAPESGSGPDAQESQEHGELF